MSEIPNWLSGVGQALEAVVALSALIYAAIEVRHFRAQRQLGHDEARATAAVDVWDTVAAAVNVIESLNYYPIRPAGNVEDQLTGWHSDLRDGIEGLNRSLGRVTLLLGDRQIYEDIELLANSLVCLVAKVDEYRKTAEPVALASKDDLAAAQTIMNRILRKLSAVALRQTPTIAP